MEIIRKPNPAAAKVVPDAAKQRPLQLAERTAERARQLVAVDTGATRDSIEAENNTVRAGGAALFLEFGTVHADPQPFLRPAARQALRELQAKGRR